MDVLIPQMNLLTSSLILSLSLFWLRLPPPGSPSLLPLPPACLLCVSPSKNPANPASPDWEISWNGGKSQLSGQWYEKHPPSCSSILLLLLLLLLLCCSCSCFCSCCFPLFLLLVIWVFSSKPFQSLFFLSFSSLFLFFSWCL